MFYGYNKPASGSLYKMPGLKPFLFITVSAAIYSWPLGFPSWVLASPREAKPGLERNETLCGESCESAVQQMEGRALKVYPEECNISDGMNFIRLLGEEGARFEAEASRWHQLGLVSCNSIRSYKCGFGYVATSAVLPLASIFILSQRTSFRRI